jgi:ABC-type glycerol-3-phosphate transport system permease component
MADLASPLPKTKVDAVPTMPAPAVERVKWSRVVIYAILVTATIVALLPFFWMISTSLMTLGETINRKWLPDVPQWQNYAEAWDQAKFPRYFGNSVIITVTTTIGMLVTSTLAGYAFARIRFFGRDVIFSLLLLTLMIPEAVTMLPNYLIVSGNIFPLPQIGTGADFISFGGTWINSVAALTIPFMASAFSIFMLRQFFMQIPNDLWDAARIDGSGHLGFLVRIVIPISTAPMFTVALLTFIGSWNAFLWPLLVTTKDTWRPLMVGLYNFTSEAGNQLHLLMAASFITILPMLILYFATQKSFTEGIATTGLKG